jgi:putative transposase
MGNLLKVTVHPADFQDAEGAELLLHGLREVFPRFAKLWADQAYKPVRDWVAAELGWDLETVARPVDQQGFEVLPRRWVVERTFAWVSRYRRLSKDYEHYQEYSESMVYISSMHILLKKLTAIR